MTPESEAYCTGCEAWVPNATPCHHMRELAAALAGPGQARATDPDTSHAAAGAVRWRARSARALLLGAFVEAGDYGLTDEQAAELAGLSLLSEYASRCSELRGAGLLVDTDERRPASSGLARVVRRVTPDGRALFADLTARVTT